MYIAYYFQVIQLRCSIDNNQHYLQLIGMCYSWVTNICKVHSTKEIDGVATQDKRQSVLPYLYT